MRDAERDPLSFPLGLRLAHPAGAFRVTAEGLLVTPALRVALAVPDHYPRHRADAGLRAGGLGSQPEGGGYDTSKPIKKSNRHTARDTNRRLLVVA